MTKDRSSEESHDAGPLIRATRHPHIPGMWCYRQKDKAYGHLRIGSQNFTEAGAPVCAIADIVDVKPDKVLAFLEGEGFVSPDSGIATAGISAAISHFGGSVPSAGVQTAIDAANLDALQEHLAGNSPAVLEVTIGTEVSVTSVVAAGYDSTREEVLLFDPRGADLDGWYPWSWVASRTKSYVLAEVPEDDPYTPRSIFKQIYGIDIAGHEQRWPDIDLKPLQQINPGCVGWIHLGGSPISYPIVRDHLDAHYYQTHNFSGEPSIHGAVVLSFSNDGSFEAPNLVFSAHRMRDSSMFKVITLYDRPDFSEERPFIDLVLGADLYRARVFSAYHYPKQRSESTRVGFGDAADFQTWLRRRIELSMHPFPTPPNVEKVATFRTCYGMDNGETFIAHASLERVVG